MYRNCPCILTCVLKLAYIHTYTVTRMYAILCSIYLSHFKRLQVFIWVFYVCIYTSPSKSSILSTHIRAIFTPPFYIVVCDVLVRVTCTLYAWVVCACSVLAWCRTGVFRGRLYRTISFLGLTLTPSLCQTIPRQRQALSLALQEALLTFLRTSQLQALI